MISEWMKYNKALQITKFYYPKVFFYFIVVGVFLLALALANALVPVLLRQATNSLSSDNAILAVILGTAAAYVYMLDRCSNARVDQEYCFSRNISPL